MSPAVAWAWRVAVGATLLLRLGACTGASERAAATAVPSRPRLHPDCAETVIPPNLAPLHVRIEEPGLDFVVRVSSDGAPTIEVECPDAVLRVEAAAWRRLLEANRGRRLYLEVFARGPDGAWSRFQPVPVGVADEPIDPYIVYRQLVPNRQVSAIRGIFQRDLESFAVSPLVTLRDNTFDCFNCHTFHQHDPNRFFFYVRGRHAGLVLYLDGRLRKVMPKQAPMFRPMAYASWHPDGRHIAATVNQFVGSFPATERRYLEHTFEKRGDLVVYDIAENTISTTRAVFENDYIETHPYWAADGGSIYFVRGRDVPLLWHQDLDRMRFDLMRIAYRTADRTWGEPETVTAFAPLGKSCAFPCPSPDGRYVLVIVSDRGTYPITEGSSDVHLVDVATGASRPLTVVNSGFSESYPRWSSNGRWFSFLSNRGDGRSALPYFAYFDAAGQAHKPFVLPQEDPSFYDDFTDTYNVVELVAGRVEVDPFALAQAMQQPAVDPSFPDPPRVDAYTGATRQVAPRAGSGR